MLNSKCIWEYYKIEFSNGTQELLNIIFRQLILIWKLGQEKTKDRVKIKIFYKF